MNVYETVNCVGIDVSKGKSTIAIMRPLGEIVQSPREVKHTLSDLKALETTLRQLEGETRIVMEYPQSQDGPPEARVYFQVPKVLRCNESKTSIPCPGWYPARD